MDLLGLVPGFLQGFVRVLISHPVDYVRTHIQKGDGPRAISYYFLEARARGLDWTHVFRGIKFPLLIVPVDRAITYWAYETMRRQQIGSFASALIVAGCTTLYQTPLQMVCAHYVLGHQNMPALQFLRRFELRSLWRGMGVEYARGVMGSTVFMGTYGALRDYAQHHDHDPARPPKFPLWAAMGCAVGAGTATWTVTYPVETLRLEHQTRPASPSVWATLRHRVATQGLGSLYRGISLVYIRSAPSAAIGMLVYELARRQLKLN